MQIILIACVLLFMTPQFRAEESSCGSKNIHCVNGTTYRLCFNIGSKTILGGKEFTCECGKTCSESGGKFACISQAVTPSTTAKPTTTTKTTTSSELTSKRSNEVTTTAVIESSTTSKTSTAVTASPDLSTASLSASSALNTNLPSSDLSSESSSNAGSIIRSSSSADSTSAAIVTSSSDRESSSVSKETILSTTGRETNSPLSDLPSRDFTKSNASSTESSTGSKTSEALTTVTKETEGTTVRTTTVPTVTPPVCSETGKGVFPAEKCNQYYECSRSLFFFWQLNLETCRSGKAFNDETKKCVASSTCTS